MRLFGTDGIRGKANEYPITPQIALKIGQAIGLYFRKRYPSPTILIGKDTRRSGYMLEQALASGICSVGVNVGFLGPLPTPGIAYLTRGMRACAGIVISASHNPFYDNGIKIFSHDGHKLPDHVEEEIEKLIFDPQLESNVVFDEKIGRAHRVEDAIGQYAVFLKEQFPKELTLEGMRIVIDCAHGSSYRVAPKVFSELGAELFYNGMEPNGMNINEGCGALYPQVMQEKVRLYKADIGLAFDGDADRLMVSDEKGMLIDGDDYLAILGKYMIEKKQLKNDTVVSTVMSNLGLSLAIEGCGGKVVRTKVGDRYVMEAMKKGGFNLGGEPSGHFILSDASTTGDGILAGLQMLRVMLESKQPLSNLRKVITKVPQVMRSVKVKRKIPIDKLPSLQDKIKSVEGELGNSGRVLFRYSGTEKKARIMVEGTESKARIEGFVDDLANETISSILQYEGTKS